MDKKLLKEALVIKVKLDHLTERPKLRKEAFQRIANEIAGTDEGKLIRLSKALYKPEFVHSRQMLRTAERWIREDTCTAPPREIRRLTWLGNSEVAIAELSAFGSGLFELFALAVRNVAQKNPEVFGEHEDLDAHKREFEDTKARYESILQKIESSYAPTDLLIGRAAEDGTARVSFKVTGGEITIGRGCGERLMNWLTVRPEAL